MKVVKLTSMNEGVMMNERTNERMSEGRMDG